MHTFFFYLNRGSDVKSISITKSLILSSTRIQNNMLSRECLEFFFFFFFLTVNDPNRGPQMIPFKKRVEWLRYTFKQLIFNTAYVEC